MDDGLYSIVILGPSTPVRMKEPYSKNMPILHQMIPFEG
jgi:hypothetical protein